MFLGIRTSVAKKPYFFHFTGPGPDPCPTSGSAHDPWQSVSIANRPREVSDKPGHTHGIEIDEVYDITH